ncbi:MAG: S-adenosylmethionine:tRNA ribosyltransferase-isomerase [Chlorobi bacterium]|nr:S-adenosylmethionine:tRNA ribosyltransferase-isomerase [Chlorobiota bacterium]
MKIKELKTENYNYNLVGEKIAKYPLKNRENSKLLVYNSGKIKDKKFYNLPELLSEKDLLVFNTTKVIQARLIFRKKTGAKIEIFCLEPNEPADYEQIFQTTKSCIWKCVVGNSKKWKKDTLVSDIQISDNNIELCANRISAEHDTQIIEFSWDNSDFTFAEILESGGVTPIPPYLNRESEESDKIRYQTVYSEQKGSVAAPTAGLHFTKEVISELGKKGIKTSNLILHVGAGTFKPVKSEIIADHDMHTEHFIITLKLIQDLISNINNIVSVGTTSVRTLESLYWLGVKLKDNFDLKDFHISQWEVYEFTLELSAKEALTEIYDYMIGKNINYFEATTQIIIVPGYKFRIVNKLITNFHQPKSTLLLLIAAFIGDDWQKVYDYALKNNFRFLSYGDSSILIP